MRIDDKQEKSSTTSSPQASPTSIGGSGGGGGNGGNNNNNVSGGKANGRIWSIVGDIETVRQDNAISSSRNWSPLRLPEEKEILRDKSLDLSQTIIPDDHLHSKSESCPTVPLPPNSSLSPTAELGIESDARSFDERSDAASSGNETSVDVEVEVI